MYRFTPKSEGYVYYRKEVCVLWVKSFLDTSRVQHEFYVKR